MRKIIIAALAAAALTPVAASAQSYGEVRGDQRQLERERRELREARRYGSRDDVRDERRDVRGARQELREDWRDYRRTHGDVYRRGAYVGPRGYRYRPVTVGYRFQPAYYGRNYWINDPYAYRLPRVGANERWVRYNRDVVRVDIRNGRVLAVLNGFFY